MKPSEIVANLDNADEDWTIFADRSTPLGPDSTAQVIAAEGEAPEGMQYSGERSPGGLEQMA
jgi:hypothetical protein